MASFKPTQLPGERERTIVEKHVTFYIISYFKSNILRNLVTK